jgi:hypothetical protein
MSVDGRDGFDTWMEGQLRSHARQFRGPSPVPLLARYNAIRSWSTRRESVSSKAAALFSTKAALGAIVAAAAVTSAGASEAVMTQSGNPASWGHQLVQQTQKCAAAIKPGLPGVADCVNAFALHHPKDSGANRQPTGAGQQPVDQAQRPAVGHSGGPHTNDPSGAKHSKRAAGEKPSKHTGGVKLSKPPGGGKLRKDPGGAKPGKHPGGEKSASIQAPDSPMRS